MSTSTQGEIQGGKGQAYSRRHGGTWNKTPLGPTRLDADVKSRKVPTEPPVKARNKKKRKTRPGLRRIQGELIY